MKARYYITEYRMRRRSYGLADASGWNVEPCLPPALREWYKEYYAIGRCLCHGVTARSLLRRTRKQHAAMKVLARIKQ